MTEAQAPPPRLRLMIRFFTLTLVLLSAALPAAAQSAAPRILVVPFENAKRDARLHWLSEACAVLLADALNARGSGAITRAERVRAFEQLHLPPAASLSRATVIKVGQMVGASEVILGSFSVTGEDLSVSVHRVRIDIGRLHPDLSERAPLPQLFALFDRIAQRVVPEGPAIPVSARDARPPLDAFENYIKGLIAESPAAQATFLETAAKEFPGYDRAQLALWEVRTEQGDDAAALAAARGVKPGSRLERRAQFLAAISLLELSRFDEAFDAFTALLHNAPVPTIGTAVKPGAALLNNLGVVQIRRGGTPQAGTAAYYLTKAAEADPGDADFLFNLGYAYVLERNYQGAIYWLRESLRRNPADSDAHYVLAAALQSTGSTVEAARERELARQLSSHYAELEKQAAADKLPVPKGLERIRTEMDAPRALRPEQTIVNSAQREQRELATFHLDRGRRLFDREEDREAMAELRRTVYLSPYEAQAHLLIGRIHLRAGRPEESVDALKISIWSEDTAAARIALAEAYLKLGNTAAARSEAERALALNPESSEAKKLLAEIGGR
jgi:tetratricopeptide (TPR) repeat protein